MMQMEFPLTIYPPGDKIAQLEYKAMCVEDSTKRVTRRLWAENRVLRQMCKELQERLEIIERNICHGK